MKSPHFRSLLLASASAIPALAHAHPGHDGDHELVWEFSHLASHPLATLACLTVAAAAGWGVWRLFKARPTAKSRPVKRD